jgi:hypothetical protein
VSRETTNRVLRGGSAESVGDVGGDVVKTSQVQGIGGTAGKALALSLIGGAVYAVIKLVDLVTD